MGTFLCTGCGQAFPTTDWRARCPGCGEPLEIRLSRGNGTSVSSLDDPATPRRLPLLARFAPLLPAKALGLESFESAASEPGTPKFGADVPPGSDSGVNDPQGRGSSDERRNAKPGADHRNPDSSGERIDGGPVFPDVLTLGEGDTPLLQLDALGKTFGLPDLYVKVEGANPTGSFKDRGTVAGVQRARAAGFRRVGTVSTGNMAGSVAAYAARAGMAAVVLVSASIPEAKLAPIAAYGPRLIGVQGDYGALYEKSLQLGPELGIAFINSDDPFRVEGQKTIAFELWQQFGSVPDVVVVPVSSGGHMAAVLKGFSELQSFGLTSRMPRLVGVQAAGCAPIATAFARGDDQFVDWSKADTIAKAIANPKPPSGNRLLRAARSGAPLHFVAVSDEDMVRMYNELMTEAGVFAQPDAAASVAAARQLKESGYLTGDESVVCILTGHGTKDLTPLTGMQSTTPDASEQPGPGLVDKSAVGTARPSSSAAKPTFMEICSLDDLASVLRR